MDGMNKEKDKREIDQGAKEDIEDLGGRLEAFLINGIGDIEGEGDLTGHGVEDDGKKVIQEGIQGGAGGQKSGVIEVDDVFHQGPVGEVG
jgi:hypothetical protein